MTTAIARRPRRERPERHPPEPPERAGVFASLPFGMVVDIFRLAWERGIPGHQALECALIEGWCAPTTLIPTPAAAQEEGSDDVGELVAVAAGSKRGRAGP